MNTVTGLTAVDTLYELMGYRMGAQFFDFLASIYLPFAIAVGALTWVYWQCLERGSFRGLIVYFCYLLFVWWLMTPQEVRVAFPAGTGAGTAEEFARLYESGAGGGSVIRVPRLLVLLHTLTDNAVKVMVARTNKTFFEHPFGSDRLSARLRQSGINDAALRERYLRFLAGCYSLALTVQATSETPPRSYLGPLDEAALGSVYARAGWVAVDRDGEPIPDRSCAKERGELREALLQHLRSDSLHMETVKLVEWAVGEAKRQSGRSLKGPGAEAFLADQIAFNETMVFSNALGSEAGLLARAVPEYSVFASSQQSTSNVQNTGQWIKSAVSFVVKGFQSVNQWFQQHAEGPAMYYKVTLYAPYIYGLVQMLLLALFPVAALWALWPGHWKALLNFGKVFISVKLWVVFWSALAAFNQARYELVVGNDPVRNGIGNQIEIFPAIAAMYLMTPTLSFMIVSLATNAGAIVFQGLIPSGSTIHGLHELHKEASELKRDGKEILNAGRTAAEIGMAPANAMGQMSGFFSPGGGSGGRGDSGGSGGTAEGAAAAGPPPVV